MKLSNIRPCFSSMDEPEQKDFFHSYHNRRAQDLAYCELPKIKIKVPKEPKAPKGEKKVTVTKEQLALLKALGLV